MRHGACNPRIVSKSFVSCTDDLLAIGCIVTRRWLAINASRHERGAGSRGAGGAAHSARSPGRRAAVVADLYRFTHGDPGRTEFDYVILDEAQAIKNEHSASAKAARLLRARHRLALTGTPIENHLGELWSVFEFLNPGVLGRSSLFQRAVSATIGEAGTIDLLAQGLRPFIL